MMRPISGSFKSTIKIEKKSQILKSYKENKENKFDEYVVPVATEEKADVSHFNLLKVLGQGKWFIVF